MSTGFLCPFVHISEIFGFISLKSHFLTKLDTTDLNPYGADILQAVVAHICNVFVIYGYRQDLQPRAYCATYL